MLSIGDAGGWGVVLVVLAGVAAGVINAVVGSGSLFTFPALLGLGVPSVTANVSNNIGLVPGNATAAWGYRDLLAGQRRRVLSLVPASATGAVTGAVLLLTLPQSVFDAAVPALIALAVVLVLVQPRLQRRLAGATTAGASTPGGAPPAGAAADARAPAALIVGAFAAGVYGGYFGAAQGVLLIGLLGVLVRADLQRLNAVKNVLALVVNTIAAVVFAVVAPDRIDLVAVLAVAAGATVGGVLGARIGRRLPPIVYRTVIAVVGVVAIVVLLRS